MPQATKRPLLLAQPLIDNDKYGAINSPGGETSERVRSGTFFGSVTNLLNNAIGSGVLIFPFAYGQTGLVFGVILSSLFASAMLFTFHVVGTAQEAVGAATYQQLMRRVLGKTGEQLSLAVQLIFLLGTCVSYLDIVADQINAAFPGQSNSMSFRAGIILAVAVGCCLPLMFMRNIQTLKFMSSVSLASVVYTLIVLIVRTSLQVHSKGMPPMVIGEPEPGQISNLRYSVDIFR
jgi:amino acid permease